MAQGKSQSAEPAPNVLQVQHQIRSNASELQDYFADLYSWEKSISKEEATRKSSTQAASVPLPRGRNVTQVASSGPSASVLVSSVSGADTRKPADAHTYDKGYNKWDKFDVIVELPTQKKTLGSTKNGVTAKTVSLLPNRQSKSREDIEREDGNEHYKRGDYVAAIKSYTRALGYNSRNVLVLSNRAMAYLKNKEYGKAEDDCSLALKIDDTHVKSYSRRGTARNSLGKHRLALSDFERALLLDPKSKQVASQLGATKDLMRTAIKRAPKRTQFSIDVIRMPAVEATTNKPELLPEVDKENIPCSANDKIAVVDDKPVSSSSTTPPPPPTKFPTTPPPKATLSSVEMALPKLPKKPATTSYEFLRVWKTFASKGNSDRAGKLLELRAKYLRMHAPTTLPTVFKNSIESEILCELFATIRFAMDVEGEDTDRVVEIVTHLPKVPRFSMVAMFLSEKEQTDISWVLDHLTQTFKQDTDMEAKLVALRTQYSLK